MNAVFEAKYIELFIATQAYQNAISATELRATELLDTLMDDMLAERGNLFSLLTKYPD